MDIELYDFKEHIDSIEWIYSLPKGMVSEKIDTRYSAVSITKLANGYEIYIGPKDADHGGDAIMITLDSNHKLLNYEIESIDPLPYP